MPRRRKFVPEDLLGMHQHAGVFLPLRPPFLVVTQGTESNVDKLPWNVVTERFAKQLQDFLDLSWGQVALQHDGNGGIEIAAFHFDTTD